LFGLVYAHTFYSYTTFGLHTHFSSRLHLVCLVTTVAGYLYTVVCVVTHTYVPHTRSRPLPHTLVCTFCTTFGYLIAHTPRLHTHILHFTWVQPRLRWFPPATHGSPGLVWLVHTFGYHTYHGWFPRLLHTPRYAHAHARFTPRFTRYARLHVTRTPTRFTVVWLVCVCTRFTHGCVTRTHTGLPCWFTFTRLVYTHARAHGFGFHTFTVCVAFTTVVRCARFAFPHTRLRATHVYWLVPRLRCSTLCGSRLRRFAGCTLVTRTHAFGSAHAVYGWFGSHTHTVYHTVYALRVGSRFAGLLAFTHGWLRLVWLHTCSHTHTFYTLVCTHIRLVWFVTHVYTHTHTHTLVLGYVWFGWFTFGLRCTRFTLVYAVFTLVLRLPVCRCTLRRLLVYAHARLPRGLHTHTRVCGLLRTRTVLRTRTPHTHAHGLLPRRRIRFTTHAFHTAHTVTAVTGFHAHYTFLLVLPRFTHTHGYTHHTHAHTRTLGLHGCVLHTHRFTHTHVTCRTLRWLRFAFGLRTRLLWFYHARCRLVYAAYTLHGFAVCAAVTRPTLVCTLRTVGYAVPGWLRTPTPGFGHTHARARAHTRLPLPRYTHARPTHAGLLHAPPVHWIAHWTRTQRTHRTHVAVCTRLLVYGLVCRFARRFALLPHRGCTVCTHVYAHAHRSTCAVCTTAFTVCLPAARAYAGLRTVLPRCTHAPPHALVYHTPAHTRTLHAATGCVLFRTCCTTVYATGLPRTHVTRRAPLYHHRAAVTHRTLYAHVLLLPLGLHYLGLGFHTGFTTHIHTHTHTLVPVHTHAPYTLHGLHCPHCTHTFWVLPALHTFSHVPRGFGYVATTRFAGWVHTTFVYTGSRALVWFTCTARGERHSESAMRSRVCCDARAACYLHARMFCCNGDAVGGCDRKQPL